MRAQSQHVISAGMVALGLAASGPATADVATMELDMSSFTYETIDVGFGAPTLTWTDRDGDASAGATGFSPDRIDDDQTLQRQDWLTEIQAAASVPGASANALANSALLRAHAEAQPSQGAICVGCVSNTLGATSANNYSSFTLSGAGGIYFRVNYSASVEGPIGELRDDATGILSLALGGVGETPTDGRSHSFVDLVSTTQGAKSETGTLVVGLFTDDAESWGSLTIQAHASAAARVVPIPEPSIAWLLLVGLGAAGWIGRRQLR